MLTIDLSGQVAIVTGGLGGIGRAIAATLRRGGARVAAWDLSADSTFDDNDQMSLAVDVTQEASVAAALALTLERFGRTDILVNGAGFVGTEVLMEELTLNEWRRIVEANLTSVFLCCRAVITPMRQRGYGRIVNIASNAGKDCNPYQSAYSAAKAAVIGLTKSIAADFVTRGVRCNAICPGTVESPSLRQRITEQARLTGQTLAQVEAAFVARQPMGRLGKPEEIAHLAVYLASDESAFTTGTLQVIDGGWSN